LSKCKTCFYFVWRAHRYGALSVRGRRARRVRASGESDLLRSACEQLLVLERASEKRDELDVSLVDVSGVSLSGQPRSRAK